MIYHEESVWCTQKAMAQLFDCSTDNIGLHLKNIYEIGELRQEATTENFSVVQTEGERQVNRSLKFYNLDAIISVGYRVNSTRYAIQTVVYVYFASVCHTWLCDRQEAYGERFVYR